MKKLSFRILISITTFFLGLGIFAYSVFYRNFNPEISTPNILPVQKKSDCAESESFPGLSQKISGYKKGKSGYFPKDNFSGQWEERDDFVNDWYGKHLKAMQEKSFIENSDENTERYRFLWLRTFHHPVFVRVERRSNEIKLFTKELDGAGSYEPGKIIRSNEITLTQEDFCVFLGLLEKANYWNLSTNKEIIGNDGAEWILEGVKNGRYHSVDRWTPEKGEYRDVCIYLLRLSGVDVNGLKSDLY